MGAAVEDVKWDPATPTTLVAADERGRLVAFDVRTAARPLWAADAHAGGCSALAFSNGAAGLAATAGADGAAALWDVTGAAPVEICRRGLEVGELFAVAFDAVDPMVLAAAGAVGTVALWDAKGESDAAAAWWVERGRPLGGASA